MRWESWGEASEHHFVTVLAETSPLRFKACVQQSANGRFDKDRSKC
jgi:hypothetical protein